MEKWFEWFKRTQHGERPGSFRWRGRQEAQLYDTELNRKTFASGTLLPLTSCPSNVACCGAAQV